MSKPSKAKHPDPGGRETQHAVFAFLGDPATHGGKPVRRCDTHAAVVFLAGDRALKVKRAVRYPFLDYSTLARRLEACRAELAANRNFAPQLYHGVIAITREADGRLALGGQGETVEWAVDMTRFDEDATLDHRAARDELDLALAAKLATAVAAMHDRAGPADAGAWIDALSRYVADNSTAFRAQSDLFQPSEVAALEQSSRDCLKRLKPLLVKRGEAGLIRRGHGDLHLGNIAVIEGEPTAFDALEFDPVIASGDLLYDLAFLLMDLVERDLNAAANTVLNGYFTACRRDADCEGLAALPFFMSLRAAIRANVTGAKSKLAAPSDRRAIARAAQRYFALALDLLKPVTPMVICTGGLSGTGKSVLARALAPDLPPAPGALVLRSDVERKSLCGVREHDRLPAEAYRPEVSDTLYRILNDKTRRIARSGYSVFVDAVFAKAHERAAVEAAAREVGAGFRGLFLTADLATRMARVSGRRHDASDADASVARQQEDIDIGAVEWTRLDASGSPEDTLRAARAAISA
jgi:aminoglycoside phosphotransferase family enzyme/predicted kinase